MSIEYRLLPVPDEVNTLTVYAFARNPYNSQQAFVICRRAERLPAEDATFVVWSLHATEAPDGTQRWYAENGHYDLPWFKALRVLAARTGVFEQDPR